VLHALKPKQVAEALNVSLTTVHTLISTGELDSFKVGRSRRVSDDALFAYVDAKTNAETPHAAERLVDQAVAQGHPRHVTDPSVIDRTATMVRRGGDAE